MNVMRKNLIANKNNAKNMNVMRKILLKRYP